MSDQKGPLLVIDDDKPFCTALATGLRRRGFVVMVAHNLKEGLSEARAFRPTRIVVDLRLGEESGLDLVSALKRELPEAKIVMLTGYGSIQTAVQATKLGAVQYVTKPLSVDALLAAFEGDPPDGHTSVVTSEPPPSLQQVEWEHLMRVLSECDGNVSEAARRLGLHRRSLQRKLARGRGG